MKQDEENLILKGGVVLGLFFFVVRPIMNEITGDPAVKEAIDSIDNSPAVVNPFSVNFGIENGTDDTYPGDVKPGTTADYAEQSKDFIMASAQKDFDGDSSQGFGDPPPPYVTKAEIINDAVGFFDIDADAVMGVFDTITYQYEVSQMAQYLLYEYGYDLWSRLKYGIPIINLIKFGIGSDNLASIINRLKSLPVFKPQQPIYL